MIRRFLALLALGGIIAASEVRADEWVTIGPSALGQGGAGVASAVGPGSVYWNPALPGLGGTEESSFVELASFGLGVDVVTTVSAEGGIVKEADEVRDFYESSNFTAVQDRLNGTGVPTAADVRTALQFVDLVNDLNEDGQGLYLAAGGSAELRLGNLTIFGHGRGYAGADPIVDFSVGGSSAITTGKESLYDRDGAGPDTGPIDLTAGGVPTTAGGAAVSTALQGVGFTVAEADALALQAELAGVDVSDPAIVAAIQSVGAATAAAPAGGTGSTLANNASGFDVKGLLLKEIGVGFAFPIVPNTFSVGVAIKEIIGETSWVRLEAAKTEGEDYADEIREGVDKNRETTTRPSMDLGVAFSPTEMFRLGLTGKDIFGAKFDLKDRSDDIELDPQVRLGMHWQPIGLLSVAADVDVIENDSDLLEGFHSRLVGGGIGLHPPIIPEILSLAIRAGAMKNVASSEAEPTYTGGLSVLLWKLKIAVGAAYAPSDVQIEAGADDEKIPQRLGVAASVGFSMEW